MQKSFIKMGSTEWFLLILLSILWGSSFFFIEIAIRDLPIFTVVAARVGLAAILLIVFVYLRGMHMPTSAKIWGEFVILGALRAAIPISLIVWAETQIDSGLAGILNATSPLFTAVLAHFFTYDDRLTGNRFVGVLLGICGVIVLIGPDALYGLGSQVMAQLAMLGATCSYGFAAIYGRRFREMPAAVSAAGMLTGATTLIVPFATILEAPWTLQPGLLSMSAVLGLALLSTAIAFIVWFRLILTAGATNTSMVTFLIPITALLLGTFILDEQLHWASFVGLVLILSGLAVAHNHMLHEALRFKMAYSKDSS
jgi:drug/metabolite transporter (DMT)-like permease